MTKEQFDLKRQVAERLGCTFDTGQGAWIWPDGTRSNTEGLPDWPTDPTAAYAVEESLVGDARIAYVIILFKICAVMAGSALWNVIHATPEQRCRAFLAATEPNGEKT